MQIIVRFVDNLLSPKVNKEHGVSLFVSMMGIVSLIVTYCGLEILQIFCEQFWGNREKKSNVSKFEF